MAKPQNAKLCETLWLAWSKDLLLLRHALKFQKLRFRDSFKNAINFFKKGSHVILVKKIIFLTA